jgi:hypothetical protein
MYFYVIFDENLKQALMQTPVALCSFLTKNTITESTVGFVKKSINEMMGESYRQGYLDALAHVKKRRSLESKRRESFLKYFLDYFSDLTHQPLER